jgi:hypothetical protein
MELTEVAHFTNDVAGMRTFYRRLLDCEPLLRDPDGHLTELSQSTESPE